MNSPQPTLNDPPAPGATQPASFSFGQNWSDYVRDCYSEERLEIAKQCLIKFLPFRDLKGKYFLDVGCGSGLHSLAAFDLGAERIVSFDLDPKSVATANALRAMRGDPANWEIKQGSILDASFLADIEPADIVYSWGVLHHTGAMWDAIRNAAKLMRPDGLFFVSLYNRVESSPFSIQLKQRYNRAGALGRRVIEAAFVVRRLVLPSLFHPWRMFRYVRDYKKSRGMSYYYDVRDWLGGWPFEVATFAEVLQFAREQLHLEWVNLEASLCDGCNEFLFARRSSPWLVHAPLTS